MPSYDYPRPALTADVVLFVPDEPNPGNIAAGLRVPPAGDVLLIKRGAPPFEGQWALPGGFVDEDETVEQAAARELSEEAGVQITAPGHLVGVYSQPGRDPRGWTVSTAFLFVLDEKPELAAGDDASDAAWFPFHEVSDLQLAFDHKLILIDAGQMTPVWRQQFFLPHR